jgi:hypothetical protein
VILFLATVAALILFPNATQAQDPSRFSTETSIQAGFEFDSNVFKAFGESEGDGVARLLLKNRSKMKVSRNWETGWNVQLGGKKFFDHDEQDVLITYIEAPLTWAPSSSFSLSLGSDFKFQDERDAKDALLNDVNEDFFSTTHRLVARIAAPGSIRIEPFGTYTYFRFSPTRLYSFHREQGGIGVRKALLGQIAVGTQYAYGRQQFVIGGREDTEHEISGSIQYLEIPFCSIRYTYQNADSTDPRFPYTNHRITLLVSLPLGPEKNGKEVPSSENNSSSMFALHLLGTLQLKKFPDVFGESQEGERFLLTGAEDENFNSIVAKFSYHPSTRFAVEAKYTRYSNELSSQTQSFERALYYAGARYDF